MKEIKDLITWAESQIRKLHRESKQCWDNNNDYSAQREWVKYTLLPKLNEVLKVIPKKRPKKRKGPLQQVCESMVKMEDGRLLSVFHHNVRMCLEREDISATWLLTYIRQEAEKQGRPVDKTYVVPKKALGLQCETCGRSCKKEDICTGDHMFRWVPIGTPVKD